MSLETIVQPSRNGQHATDVVKTPDPEVVPKAERRKFSSRIQAAHSQLKPMHVRAGRDRRPAAPGRAVPVAPGQMA